LPDCSRRRDDGSQSPDEDSLSSDRQNCVARRLEHADGSQSPDEDSLSSDRSAFRRIVEEEFDGASQSPDEDSLSSDFES